MKKGIMEVEMSYKNLLIGILALFFCGITTLEAATSGTVWAWGKNDYGQLGNGTNTASDVPVQVSNLTDVTQIASGDMHNVALKSDGTVWTWGDNSNGQLGNGTVTNSNVPVQVSNLTGVKAIGAGWYHSLAVKNDGTVWTWGDNTNGQLGDGTNTSSNVPVQVSSLSNVKIVAGSPCHSLALKNDGTVWAWGHGPLGNGYWDGSLVPVQVLYLDNIVAISAGDNGGAISIAISSSGILYIWGCAQIPDYLGGGLIPVEMPGIDNVSALTTTIRNISTPISLKADGSVWYLGMCSSSCDPPCKVPGLYDNDIVDIGEGNSISNGGNYAIKSDRTLMYWISALDPACMPTIFDGISNVLQVTSGVDFSVAISSSAQDQNILSVFATPTGEGNTVPAQGTYSITQEESTSISAVPVAGYKFKNWTVKGGATVESATSWNTTVNLSSHGAIFANFEKSGPDNPLPEGSKVTLKQSDAEKYAKSAEEVYETSKFSFSGKVPGNFSTFDDNTGIRITVGEFDSASYFTDIASLKNSQALVKPKVSVNAEKGKGSITYYFAYQYQDKKEKTKLKKVGSIKISWNNKALSFNIKGNCSNYTDWQNKASLPVLPVDTSAIQPADGIINGSTECSVFFGDKNYSESDLSYTGKYKTKTDKTAGELKKHDLSGKIVK